MAASLNESTPTSCLWFAFSHAYPVCVIYARCVARATAASAWLTQNSVQVTACVSRLTGNLYGNCTSVTQLPRHAIRANVEPSILSCFHGLCNKPRRELLPDTAIFIFFVRSRQTTTPRRIIQSVLDNHACVACRVCDCLSVHTVGTVAAHPSNLFGHVHMLL